MDLEKLKTMLDATIESWAESEKSIQEGEAILEAKEERVLPEGKRVVRTKSSGDRVYMIDEVKKTRQWVTNPDVLQSLGFEITDVKEVEDQELMGFQMGPALYKVENATP